MSHACRFPEDVVELLDRFCEGELAPDEAESLERHVCSDPAVCRLYLRYVDLHVELFHRYRLNQVEKTIETVAGADQARWTVGRDQGIRGLGNENPQSPIPNQQISCPELQTPSPEPPVQQIILDLSSPILSPLSPLPSFVGGPVFSYMVATVILAAMLLGAWAYKITHYQQYVALPAPSSGGREMVFVGQITGMVDCRWADPQTETYLGASVPLGRQYALASGLMEITYKSGAKVILEGPCTYEVESRAGGFLSLGKLTAKVESGEWRVESAKLQAAKTQAPSPKPQAQNPKISKSPNLQINSPLSTLHSPLFSVRTPTAIVTDLGTEFGVEVDESGATQAHVFQGKVEVRMSGDGHSSPNGEGAGGEDNSRVVRLGANQSARVEGSAIRIFDTAQTAAGAKDEKADKISLAGVFVRQMPRRMPIKVFNTGNGLKEGDEDMQWQLFARSKDPNFKPRPAVVTCVPSAYTGAWPVNDPARSQWISLGNGPPDVPNVTYTFRTTFELVGARPGTAVLRGWFIADNHVDAIRLNGESVPVPEHDCYPPFYIHHRFSATKGFVPGTNVLEIDVANVYPDHPDEDNPMGLRVELEGAFTCDPRTSPPTSSVQHNSNAKEVNP